MAKRAAESSLQIHLAERWPDGWITVILPASRVTHVRASLPRAPAAKLARLSPFAVKDAIAPPPGAARMARATPNASCIPTLCGAGAVDAFTAVLAANAATPVPAPALTAAAATGLLQP